MILSIDARAGQVTAAIAANFAGTIKHLKPVFEKDTGHRLVTSFASTGTLFAQIHNGAPFDVFLSADAQRPRQLIADGLGVADSLFIYASGHDAKYCPGDRSVQSGCSTRRAGRWHK